MKVILESTSAIVMLTRNGDEQPARVWEGETEDGIRVRAFVTLMLARDAATEERLRLELEAVSGTSALVEPDDAPLTLIM